MCLSAIYWARLSKIYYGNTRKDAADIQFDDDFLYQEIPKAIEDRQVPMVQCGHPEALEVFKEWAAKVDKVPY
ncbi:Guanine deaminase [compost metagenome]